MEKFNSYPFQYFPKYYTDDTLLKKIKDNVNFNQDKIKVGKEELDRIERRKTSWLSDNEDLTFEYSGKVMQPQKIPEYLRELIIKTKNDFGLDFDGILVNYYENGQVGMGYHSDPIEEKWDNNFVIFSIGVDRKFIFREKSNIENKITYNFSNGDLIYMYDNCQELYDHSVRKNKLDGERISLVFKKLRN